MITALLIFVGAVIGGFVGSLFNDAVWFGAAIGAIIGLALSFGAGDTVNDAIDIID